MVELYPFHCPVVMTALPSFMQMGALDQHAQNALNFFSNNQGILSGPAITNTWNMPPVGMGSTDIASFVTSMRRLHDEAELRVTRYFEIENRLQKAKLRRDATQRTQPSMPAVTAVAGQRRPSTLSGISMEYERKKQDEIDLDEARLSELKNRPSFRTASTMGSYSGKPRWHLSLLPPEQGSLFVSEDGRSIHIRQVTSQSAILGYGWFRSAMHYVEFESSQKQDQKQGRSVALFSRDEYHRIEVNAHWFEGLIKSMRDFYSPFGSGADGKIVISSKDARQLPQTWQGSWTDAASLALAFRTFTFSSPFKIETEKTVLGYRDKDLSAVEAAVPLAEIRYEPSTSEAQVLRSYYRAPKSSSLGETDLSDDMRKRLRFAAPVRPSSRP